MLNVYSVLVVKPDGEEIRRRLRPAEFHEIVAASNLKQRTRMLTLYLEAERRNYCVVGTANNDEYDLGFFVKYGDGGVDMQPISHLFKTQVYAIAEVVGVPETVRQRPPTTDTCSAECTQEEFFYRLPFHLLDAIWEGGEAGEPAAEIAQRVGTPILMMFAYRAPDYAHSTLEITAPITPEATPAATLARCLAVIEVAIRARPAEWFYWPRTDTLQDLDLLPVSAATERSSPTVPTFQ